jgi:hypothetical protein
MCAFVQYKQNREFTHQLAEWINDKTEFNEYTLENYKTLRRIFSQHNYEQSETWSKIHMLFLS